MAKSKIAKASTVFSCTLLMGMALFHGSGLHYVNELMQQSNSKPFLIDIFPVLFAHPSIHLLGLAGFGLLTLFMKHEIKKVLFFTSLLVCIDALLAFYLGAVVPGVLLVFSALSLVLGAIKTGK
ncbi:hypothetical protein FGF1_08070 [Flavobacteriaceae bacterium GF1]